jgi:hypothetical protein
MNQDKKTKAIFFLRHNNDIDHMTPVIYKWVTTKNIPTDVYIMTNKDILQDYRIQFLKQQKNIRVIHLNDLFKKISMPYIFNLKYFKYSTNIDRMTDKYQFIGKLAKKTIDKMSKKIFQNMENGFVAFDWTTIFFVKEIIQKAKDKGFKTISLPHGDWPYVNYLIQMEDFNHDVLKTYEPAKIFDYVVVPNKSCAFLYEKYIEKDRLKILGSPRYCDEWIKIIDKIIPKYENPKGDGKLKIVFFLRNIGYPIFWEMVIRTIKLILQTPNVYLVVKHHPRNTKARKITKKLISFYPEIKDKIGKNLEFIYGEEHSGALIRWADLIIDVGTSATWEAVKLRKPVLMPEYLHANYSKIAYYFKNSEIRSRDEMINQLQRFSEGKNIKFYDQKERDEFIEKIIEVPDNKILERYVKLLESCL